VLLGDQMAMRINFGIAEEGCHPVFKALRNEMLQSLGLLVDLVPGILQYLVQKQFQKTVVPHKFPRAPLPGLGQADTPMFFIYDQPWPMGRELLQHAGYGGRSNAKAFGKHVARHSRLGSSA